MQSSEQGCDLDPGARFTSCVTLDKWLHFSVLPFAAFKMGIIKLTSLDFAIGQCIECAHL